ncbi:hypothetical protein SHJG_7701 [Streptomyces hygroscopicus subsp. jinggangensis 5008]|nr:hypothetical protein SHJG_7701 [Streptomyces hygroscopicus subsp. jinggangensis 5008]AGF67125.1 hypothetical protein SHJGH_7463 [Streptomyces hygroscopicus subsp. jinggangensis TL01]
MNRSAGPVRRRTPRRGGGAPLVGAVLLGADLSTARVRA